MKYILNYTKVINQLFVLSVLKIWKKLSGKRELNSCLWSPKAVRSKTQKTVKVDVKRKKRRKT